MRKRKVLAPCRARGAHAVQSGELDLDLRDCGLGDLPDALFDLQWLQVVDLSRNALVPRVFEELRDLAGLRAVNLAQNLLSSALPAMLTSVAEFYEEDVNTKMTAALSLIEPAIMIFMGIFVAFVLIALYLPIFSLADTIR